MLVKAKYLIESGLIPEACVQLLDAYQRTDDSKRPPDFVEGDAASDLAVMIQDLRESLACE